ncbi:MULTISPECIES: hypothetical protein [unclassified Mesorhizobium]|uniref:hypothetical protein n=1 Tax=unclassified Mesorhizobium TaxID=325217 RepID=UPI000F74CCFD|nr:MULTISPECIES: hypothetical protein [unclassified Mesorhizobium]AZO56398.1 hypothetical protein EJ077_25585 [Mesorhizobium sp. M8A.F.Ca.ET.057.01.1.1]RWE48736.1 MAG: hypothetical protein EOS80_04295 [Mesorhizobium sp.]
MFHAGNFIFDVAQRVQGRPSLPSGRPGLVRRLEHCHPLPVADDVTLTNAGCGVIGPASSVKDALERIDSAPLDGAVLDVNLNGERSFPIAEHLASRGIPFVFLAGYDSTTMWDRVMHGLGAQSFLSFLGSGAYPESVFEN